MTLVKCKECGESVSNEANTCPKCGIKKPYDPETKVLVEFVSGRKQIAEFSLIEFTKAYNKCKFSFVLIPY